MTKNIPFFPILHIFAPLKQCTRVQCLVLKNNPNYVNFWTSLIPHLTFEWPPRAIRITVQITLLLSCNKITISITSIILLMKVNLPEVQSVILITLLLLAARSLPSLHTIWWLWSVFPFLLLQTLPLILGHNQQKRKYILNTQYLNLEVANRMTADGTNIQQLVYHSHGRLETEQVNCSK